MRPRPTTALTRQTSASPTTDPMEIDMSNGNNSTSSGTYMLRLDEVTFEQAVELLRKLRAEGYKAEYV